MTKSNTSHKNAFKAFMTTLRSRVQRSEMPLERGRFYLVADGLWELKDGKPYRKVNGAIFNEELEADIREAFNDVLPVVLEYTEDQRRIEGEINELFQQLRAIDPKVTLMRREDRITLRRLSSV